MQIRDVMTTDVKTLTPDQTIQEAAALMEKIDSGALLINDQDRLVGMITDRDIAIRAVAKGLDAQTPVHQIMSKHIRYCFDDESVQHVAENMAENELRRMPVLNREKRLVGVVSLGNIASSQNQQSSDTVLQGVTRAH